jgi:hypothetical protein
MPVSGKVAAATLRVPYRDATSLLVAAVKGAAYEVDTDPDVDDRNEGVLRSGLTRAGCARTRRRSCGLQLLCLSPGC